jgi:hypothetical protein
MRMATQSAKYQLSDSHFMGQNAWILKATGFNRGIGIHVFNKIEDLRNIMKDYTDSLPVTDQVFKCQKLLYANSDGTKNFKPQA